MPCAFRNLIAAAVRGCGLREDSFGELHRAGISEVEAREQAKAIWRKYGRKFMATWQGTEWRPARGQRARARGRQANGLSPRPLSVW